MRDLAKNIRLPSIDDLFSTEEERQDAKLEKIQILPLSELHPFEGHPFQVRDDEEMQAMVSSVKDKGVTQRIWRDDARHRSPAPGWRI